MRAAAGNVARDMTVESVQDVGTPMQRNRTR